MPLRRKIQVVARQVFEVCVCTGEDGRLAYEQLDTVPREMVRLGTRRGNAVTTAF